MGSNAVFFVEYSKHNGAPWLSLESLLLACTNTVIRSSRVLFKSGEDIDGDVRLKGIEIDRCTGSRNGSHSFTFNLKILRYFLQSKMLPSRWLISRCNDVPLNSSISGEMGNYHYHQDATCVLGIAMTLVFFLEIKEKNQDVDVRMDLL